MNQGWSLVGGLVGLAYGSRCALRLKGLLIGKGQPNPRSRLPMRDPSDSNWQGKVD